MRFTKMHGIGNDYIYVDTSRETVADPAALARVMSRPHFGVGSDGLVLIMPGTAGDFRMRMFNSDGSEGSMCGNAARCIGKYVYERGLTDKTGITLETKAGLKLLQLKIDPADGKVKTVQVDMGVPVFDPDRIPVRAPSAHPPRVSVKAGSETVTGYCCSMGNPHCVILTEHPEDLALEKIGPAIENDPIFPDRTNVEFIRVNRRDDITMRVWERGAGETLACGTGACAVLAVCSELGLTDPEATVHLRGGDLKITRQTADDHILQEGGAAFVFDGEWPEGTAR